MSDTFLPPARYWPLRGQTFLIQYTRPEHFFSEILNFSDPLFYGNEISDPLNFRENFSDPLLKFSDPLNFRINFSHPLEVEARERNRFNWKMMM